MRAVADIRNRRPSGAGLPPTVGPSSPSFGLGTNTREDVIQVAMMLGMDPYTDQDVMWIAERALSDPLPGDWAR
eukprot:4274064-Pyramimonas_sp.AAC.1